MSVLVSILVAPIVAGLLCLLLPSRRAMALTNVLGFAVTLGLSLQLLPAVLQPPYAVTECDEFFRADALSAWMALLISVVSLGSALYAGRYFRRDLAAQAVTPGRVKEFYVLTPLFSGGMFLVVLANNLGVMWFALEATALSSVLLVAIYNRKTSLEAAWKYVILGSLGLALALFGTVFTYAAAIDQRAATGLPNFNWSHLMAIAGQLDTRMIKLAFVFVLVGYGTKAGLAPMHTWLPDAHSEAPSPTSAMLSGVSLKVALYALLRFHILTTASLGTPFSQTLLLVFGLASMCLAAPFILVQTNLKRLLAYSSLEHVGLICAGIGLNSPMTIFGALLHMGYHALTKPVLFFAAGNIHQTWHTLQLRRIGTGVAKVLPWTALCLGLGGAAAAGLPPFGLFFSELTVLSGGFASGQTAATAILLGAILASFCGILYQLTRILPGTPKVARTTDASPLDGVPTMVLMLGTLLVFSLWLPAPLLEVVRQAARVIGGLP
ncbi:MAG TPA: proton-conducting transporter membrane subunit [Candidatus Paceibacterota bacterium]|nr:proton-conducting transporter membrane subunit [Verrucomicrobiota bacterium]HSA11229.1 proton-conducting transporter membrane subunit [Candidatus Paceibacterota bacterium]